MATHSLTLQSSQLASLASVNAATPPAKADRDMSPVLAAVAVQVLPHNSAGRHRVTATATDRYLVAVLAFDVELDAFASESKDAIDGRPVEPLAILGTALVALEKATRKAGPVTLHWTDRDEYGRQDAISATWAGGSMLLGVVPGNLPPVGRLLPDSPEQEQALMEGARLKLGFFARLSKIVPPVDAHRWDACYSFSQKRTPDADANGRAGRGPVILRASDDSAGWAITCLVQPNLILR